MIRWICVLIIAALAVAPAFAQEKEGEPAEKPAEEKKDPEKKQGEEKEQKEKKQDAVFGHPGWPKLTREEEIVVERVDDLGRLSEAHMRAGQIITIGECVRSLRRAIRQFIVQYAMEKTIEYLRGDHFFIVRSKAPDALYKMLEERSLKARIDYLNERTKNKEEVNETPEEVAAGVKKQRETARAALLKGLKEDKKCDVREQCAGFLAKIAQDKEVVDALVERLLKDGWSKVRAMCVDSLGKIEDPSCLEALRQALDTDPYSTVRQPAAEALLKFKDRQAEPLFIKGLKDGWSNVRLICARALGELGSQKAFQPLSESLNDKYPVVRAEAALSLGKIGDASVLPGLQKAAGDEDPGVREAVYEAIAKIAKRHSSLQTKAADFLANNGLGDQGFSPRLFAVRGLVQLKDKRGADEIVKILKSDRMFERIAGIQLAAEEKVTDASVMAALEKMAKSGKKDALDTKEAAEALEKLRKK